MSSDPRFTREAAQRAAAFEAAKHAGPEDTGPWEDTPMPRVGHNIQGAWQTIVLGGDTLRDIRYHARHRGSLNMHTPPRDPELQREVEGLVYTAVRAWLDQRDPKTPWHERNVSCGMIAAFVGALLLLGVLGRCGVLGS